MGAVAVWRTSAPWSAREAGRAVVAILAVLAMTAVGLPAIDRPTTRPAATGGPASVTWAALAGLQAEIGPTGVVVEPAAGGDAAGWEVRLALVGVGRPGDVRAVPHPTMVSDADRAEQWYAQPGAGAPLPVTGWWVPHAEGLEQGWTVHAPPPTTVSGPLRIEQTVDSDLLPVVDGDELWWFDPATADPQARYHGLRAWDATGRDLPTTLTLSGRRLVIEVDDADAVYPVEVDPVVSVRGDDFLRIVPEEGPISDFGTSVAVDGDTAVVGSPESRNAGGLRSGAVLIYQRDTDGAWSQVARFDTDVDRGRLGSALALAGDTLIAAAERGVFLKQYERGTDGTWAEVATLTAADRATTVSGFGFSLDLDGDLLAVGDLNYTDATVTDPGAVVLFGRDGTGAFIEEAVVSPSGDHGATGAAVDLDGMRLAVGSPTVSTAVATGTASAVGAVDVFRPDGGVWTEVQRLRPPDPEGSMQRYGLAVRFDGDQLLVGAPNNSQNRVPGVVHVLDEQPDGTFTHATAFEGPQPSSARNVDGFGEALAVVGDTLLVGAGEDPVGSGGDRAGRVHVFARQADGSWAHQHIYDDPAGVAQDRFGSALAFDGTTAIVGAPQGEPSDDDGPTGMAFLLDRTVPPPPPPFTPHVLEGPEGFELSVAVQGDTAVVARPDGTVVFDRDGAGWRLAQTLDVEGYSVAMDGDLIAVGTYSWCPSGASCPDSVSRVPVTLFQRQGDGTWAPLQQLMPDESTGIAYADWGVELALQDGTLAVADPSAQAPGEAEAAGVVSIYEQGPDGQFAVTQQLSTGKDTTADTWAFGTSIALDGDVLAVGDDAREIEFPDGEVNAGVVTVFTRQPDGTWDDAEDVAPRQTKYGWGLTIGLDGDTLVGGVIYDDRDPGPGAAYVFQRQPDGSWVETRRLTPDDAVPIGAGDAENLFGAAVALDGNRLLITAPHDQLTREAGSAYVFERDPDGEWGQAAKLVDPIGFNDRSFGQWFDFGGPTAALDGTHAVIAVNQYDDYNGHPGAALVFDLPPLGSGDVGGGIDITVSGDEPLDGARVFAFSSSAGDGASGAPDASRQATLTGLAAADDYLVRLVGADGTELARADGVSVIEGGTTPVGLDPVVPATVTVTVEDEDGEPWPPGGSARIDLRRGVALLASHEIDEAGVTRIGPVPAGDAQLVVATQPAPEDHPAVVTQDVTLERGHQTATVVVEPIPPGRVTGTVTLPTGDPAPGVWVRELHGQPETITSSDGTYSLELRPGQRRLAFMAPNVPRVIRDVSLASGEEVVEDIALSQDRPAQYHIATDFVLDPVDGDPAPGGDLTFEWGPNLHYAPAGPSTWQYSGQAIGVRGYIGDRFRVCAGGSRTGYPRGCSPWETLGTDREVPTTLTLRQAGVVQGRLVRGSGQPMTGGWSVDVARLDADGQPVPPDLGTDHDNQLATTVRGSGSQIRVPVPEPGTHRLTFRAMGRSRTVLVAVADGEVVALGDVDLFGGGPFTRGGNGVAVLGGPDLLPGGIATVRTTIVNTTGEPVTGAVAHLGIPPATTALPAGTTLDGQPVTGTVTGQVAVPLDDLDPGATATLTHVLELDGVTPGTTLVVESRIVHDGSGEAGDLVGTAAAGVAGLTLRADQYSHDRGIVVAGRGIPGRTVTVLSNHFALGEAQVTEAGTWRLPISLPDLGIETTHPLVAASTGLDGAPVTTPPTFVTIDATRPIPTELCLVRAGRTDGFCTDLTDADPGFYVNLGARGLFDARVTFDDPTRVENARIRFGDTPTLPMQARGDGTFVLPDPLPFPSQYSGAPIYLDYDVTPAPLDLTGAVVPTEAQMRGALPPGLELGAADGESSDETAHVVARGALPDGEPFEIDVSIEEASYTPTAEDLAHEAETGIPLWNQSVQVTEDGIRVTGFVPDDALGDPQPQFAGAVKGMASAVKGMVVAYEITTNIYSVISGAQNAGSVLGRVQRAAYLYDWAGSCLAEGRITQDEYDDLVVNHITAVVIADTVEVVANTLLLSAGLAAVVIGLAIATGPLGFAVGVLLFAGSEVVSALLAELTQAAENDAVNAIAERCGAPPRDPSSPVDAPTWLYDPSGYVYEAVESNRLEDVTATVVERVGGRDGPAKVWNAHDFGQVNPHPTDADGRYGWDVPEGFWQVLWSKDGYQPAQSAVLEVLPPRFDVNAGLVNLSAPEVTATAAYPDAVEFTFSRYMAPDTVADATTVTDAAGDPISGTVTPLDAEADPGGRTLARTFAFAPDTPFGLGAAVTFAVGEFAFSYADRPMAARYEEGLTVTERPADLPPQAIDDSRSLLPGTEAYVGVLLNDTDPEDGSLTLEDFTQPAHGSAIRFADDVIHYLPDSTFEGTDTLTYTVADEAGNRDTATVTFAVAEPPPPSTTNPPGEDPDEGTPPADGGGDDGERPVGVVQIGGATRYDTTALVIEATYPDGAGTVFVTTGEGFPDTLSVGPAAVTTPTTQSHSPTVTSIPLLLVAPDHVPDPTGRALAHLQPHEIVVIGGEAVVSAAVEAHLASFAEEVSRVAGPDRYTTAAAIADRWFPGTADTVWLATGEDYPDGLAASAAAGRDGAPLLLTAPDRLPDATRDALLRMAPSRVFIAGGQAAVSTDVQAQVAALTGAAVTRLAGPERYATAAVIAATYSAPTSRAFVATGAAFPDALVLGPVAAASRSPLLLTAPDHLPDPTTTQLRRLSPDQVVIAGGAQAVSPAVTAAIEEVARR